MARAGALAALALFVGVPRAVGGQDSVAVHRHLLAYDVTRIRPFSRTYDVLVHLGDSARVIGQRDVTLSAAEYAGQPVWLLVETRTGIVPAVDTLFLASDMRPIHWSSDLGKSRLGVEFTGDSLYGATVTPAARRSLILGGRPDLLVSTAMIETIVSLLPLSAGWSDSAAVLSVDAGDAVVVPVELAITGEEQRTVIGDTTMGAWVFAVKAERGEAQLWVDKLNGSVTRIEQSLPTHVGSRLEFRLRPALPSETTPP